MRRRDFIAGIGAAGWPLLVRAQQQTKLTIGYLDFAAGGRWPEVIEGIRRGLAEVSFSEGRDVTVEYHTADGHPERLPALAADLVRQRPAAILAGTAIAALAAKAATPDIPIIFGTGADPVELGLVASLNRPGGNLTGVANLGGEIAEKRLELLHKAVRPLKQLLCWSVLPIIFCIIRQRLGTCDPQPVLSGCACRFSTYPPTPRLRQSLPRSSRTRPVPS